MIGNIVPFAPEKATNKKANPKVQKVAKHKKSKFLKSCWLGKKTNRSKEILIELSIIIFLINIRILEIFTGFDVFYYMFFVY